jgi:hypothetical protein
MKNKIVLLLVLGLTTIAGIRFATPTYKAPTNPIIEVDWRVEDSKAYAQDMLSEWQYKEWLCLNKLWTKESNWRPNAYNKVKVMGKNAGGIPQLLGLDPKTPPPLQIDRGLSYIYYRYNTPCKAWKFFNKNGYY